VTDNRNAYQWTVLSFLFWVVQPHLLAEDPFLFFEGKPPLKVGFGNSQANADSQRKFTRHSIEFVVVETKRFVSRNVDVMLTLQTCGQR